jgi:hypothetical protein
MTSLALAQWVRNRFSGSRTHGALRSGVKEETRRSRVGGHPRSRAPCGREPARCGKKRRKEDYLANRANVLRNFATLGAATIMQ